MVKQLSFWRGCSKSSTPAGVWEVWLGFRRLQCGSGVESVNLFDGQKHVPVRLNCFKSSGAADGLLLHFQKNDIIG